MEHGTVKWFDEEKGYGFIILEDGKELVVHKSGVESGYLMAGQTVDLEIGEGRKGPCAVSVKSG